MENEIKNEIKVKPKYWHECQHCSHQHSTKIKKNKVIEQKNIIENEATENELEMKLELKQNIGMSVHIAVINTK